MNPRLTLPIIAAVIIAVAVSILSITSHSLTVKHLSPSPVSVPVFVNYGALGCWGHNVNVVIPGNSMVVLRYHVHGDVTINFVGIYMAFPASIVNKTLTVFSKLPNQNDALIMGVYVNGRLIASTNYPGPILSLKTVVEHTNGVITADYTDDDVSFPPINLTGGDVIIVVIYSAVPYALPSCPIASESEEVGLMVRGRLIGLIGIVNGTPTAEQLYEEGRYITEEPVVYIINVTNPMNQLPQELTPSLLT
ncbi:hypothetical protein, partial [Vulcanisaeta sp. JCM 14467]|uniref:hypothetical protein n=1 Tax=Vulcanisaeta sp. JCM 14467 TaxID=1295370 RepID=UPI000A8376D0